MESSAKRVEFCVRVHGRGGQGVVTAAELLSLAAFNDGLHAQAFPSFGSERTGAPVVSFCRISTRPIRMREPVLEPDALIVQDSTLLAGSGIFDGLRESGAVLINSSREVGRLPLGEHAGRAISIPASAIARRCTGRPLPNATLLGGFAAMTGRVSLDSVVAAIGRRFSATVADANVLAAREAHVLVTELLEGRERVHA